MMTNSRLQMYSTPQSSKEYSCSRTQISTERPTTLSDVLVFSQLLHTNSRVVPQTRRKSFPSTSIPINLYTNHDIIRRYTAYEQSVLLTALLNLFPSLHEKALDLSRHYAVSGYHSNEISNVNTLHERNLCSMSQTSEQYRVCSEY